MLDDFMVRAALAGVGVALAAGPLGCFVVWRRMAYFGDATAHAAILGVAIALIAGLPVTLAVLAVALAAALGVTAAAGRAWAMDTLLGVAAHSALAIGLVAASFAPGMRIDLESYLFGDVLSVSKSGLLAVWLGAGAVLALLAWRWTPLLTSTLSDDLSSAEGGRPAMERLALTVALAALVAIALKVVGALLVTAMLIVPAAAARGVARGPESMAVIAAAVGAVSALAGLQGAFVLDAPAGPSMVAAAALCLVILNGGAAIARRLRRAPLSR